MPHSPIHPFTHTHTARLKCIHNYVLFLSIHTHTYTDGYNVGFSVLPKDASTCTWSRTTDLPINGRLLFLLSYSRPQCSVQRTQRPNSLKKWKQLFWKQGCKTSVGWQILPTLICSESLFFFLFSVTWCNYFIHYKGNSKSRNLPCCQT